MNTLPAGLQRSGPAESSLIIMGWPRLETASQAVPIALHFADDGGCCRASIGVRANNNTGRGQILLCNEYAINAAKKRARRPRAIAVYGRAAARIIMARRPKMDCQRSPFFLYCGRLTQQPVRLAPDRSAETARCYMVVRVIFRAGDRDAALHPAGIRIFIGRSEGSRASTKL
jgi:hypothetical protein